MKLIRLVLLMFVWASLVQPLSHAAVSSDLTDGRAFVTERTGEVKVWKETQREWRAAEVGTMLEGGDRIVTGANSSAVVAYDQEGKDTVRLAANSEMVLKTVEPTDAYLVVGHMLVKLDKLAPGSTFKVGTEDAVTGVFGTTFEVVRHNDLTCVIGRAGTVYVFGLEKHKNAIEFSTENWWGGKRLVQ